MPSSLNSGSSWMQLERVQRVPPANTRRSLLRSRVSIQLGYSRWYLYCSLLFILCDLALQKRGIKLFKIVLNRANPKQISRAKRRPLSSNWMELMRRSPNNYIPSKSRTATRTWGIRRFSTWRRQLELLPTWCSLNILLCRFPVCLGAVETCPQRLKETPKKKSSRR